MWSLARISGRDVTWVSLILGVDALVRGLNYVNIQRLSPVLGTVQRAFHLTTWGIAFLVAAAFIFGGYALKVRWALALGHGLIATLYLGLSTGIATAIIGAGVFEQDVRTVVTYAAIALIHGLLAWKITEARLHRIHVRRHRSSRE